MKYMAATENNVTLYVDIGAYVVITFSIPPVVEKMKKHTCYLGSLVNFFPHLSRVNPELLWM